MKEDLYIINYRNSYLSPICLIQEDNKNLKILITNYIYYMSLFLEILSINKENKTITLLLYKDFPNKNTTLINLPLEFVSKIIKV